MTATSTEHAADADRNRSAAVVRRQLLTARGSDAVPPRVVLHLPDLDLLSSVALGPPRPAVRRRVDPPHAVVTDLQATKPETHSHRLASSVKRHLADLVRAPVDQAVDRLASSSKLSLTRLIVALQSPKMLLAGVTAIALQFAAMLAMFTGGGASTSTPASTDVSTAPQVSLPGPLPLGGASGPIQTPLSSPNVFLPSTPGLGGPTMVAQPSLPPPQSLPGLDPRDLPPWSGGGTVPLANQPAVLPVLPSLGGSPRATSAVQTNNSAAGKPKARLQGTIKKASISETAP